MFNPLKIALIFVIVKEMIAFISLSNQAIYITA